MEWPCGMVLPNLFRVPSWSSSSVLDHRSLTAMFEFRRGYIWRLFHLWLCFITFGGWSAHLVCHVHKSGRKTSIIIIWSVFNWNLNSTNYLLYHIEVCKLCTISFVFWELLNISIEFLAFPSVSSEYWINPLSDTPPPLPPPHTLMSN